MNNINDLLQEKFLLEHILSYIVNTTKVYFFCSKGWFVLRELGPEVHGELLITNAESVILNNKLSNEELVLLEKLVSCMLCDTRFYFFCSKGWFIIEEVSPEIHFVLSNINTESGADFFGVRDNVIIIKGIVWYTVGDTNFALLCSKAWSTLEAVDPEFYNMLIFNYKSETLTSMVGASLYLGAIVWVVGSCIEKIFFS